MLTSRNAENVVDKFCTQQKLDEQPINENIVSESYGNICMLNSKARTL